jgi:fluoroacetyl-CoA thioesterase
MEERFAPGLRGESIVTVTPEMTAHHYGNPGVHVLATLRLIGFLELAAVDALKNVLLPGEATVGTQVDVRHEAATPMGMTVRALAELTQVEGRRLIFAVRAFDESGRVGSGTHERYLVDLDRFLSRLNNKARST